jgi:hypothetical protein
MTASPRSRQAGLFLAATRIGRYTVRGGLVFSAGQPPPAPAWAWALFHMRNPGRRTVIPCDRVSADAAPERNSLDAIYRFACRPLWLGRGAPYRADRTPAAYSRDD